jgi:glycerate 2-kinase
LLEGCPIVISRTVLIAARPFGRLSASGVGAAIARGLRAGGWLTDVCPIVSREEGAEDLEDVRALLEAVDFDARMRRARAVVLGEWRLEERTLAGSAAFEIATRARQAGVPAYAVAGTSALGAFDTRILDLQVIIEAASAHSLQAAGKRLAELV